MWPRTEGPERAAVGMLLHLDNVEQFPLKVEKSFSLGDHCNQVADLFVCLCFHFLSYCNIVFTVVVAGE